MRYRSIGVWAYRCVGETGEATGPQHLRIVFSIECEHEYDCKPATADTPRPRHRPLRPLRAQAKTGVDEVRAFVDACFIDDHRNFYFRGGDHLDVDARLAEQFEHFGGDTGVRSHPDSDDAQFGDAALCGEPFRADFGDNRSDVLFDLWQLVRVRRKRNVSGAGGGDVLNDHVDVHIDRGDLIENPGSDAGFVRHACDCDFCLSTVNADSANDHFFHTGCFFFHNGSWLRIEATPHLEDDGELFRKLDRSRLHHLRAEACHLKHFIIGDLRDLLRISDDARVASVYPVDISINLTNICPDCGSNGNGGEV